MKTLVLASALLAALAAPARADTPDEAVTLDVEVVESTKKTSQTATFTFTVAFDGACAEATSDARDLRFRLEVCRRHGHLTFDVTRVEHGKTSVHNHIKVSSKLAPGKRAVVGKIARGDDATEIAATIRQ